MEEVRWLRRDGRGAAITNIHNTMLQSLCEYNSGQPLRANLLCCATVQRTALSLSDTPDPSTPSLHT